MIITRKGDRMESRYLLAIVCIVAIIGMTWMFSGGTVTGEAIEDRYYMSGGRYLSVSSQSAIDGCITGYTLDRPDLKEGEIELFCNCLVRRKYMDCAHYIE